MTDENPEAGSFTITPVHSGFLIGRVLPQFGPGPWWSFIKIVPDLDAAIAEGQALASAENVRLWLQENGTTYRPLPLDRPPETDAE